MDIHRETDATVGAAKLWVGARPGEYEVLNNLFRTMSCIPIDQETGRQAGIYLQQYRRSHAVEIADALIAASAVAYKADLWTRDRRHYPMKEVTFFE